MICYFFFSFFEDVEVWKHHFSESTIFKSTCTILVGDAGEYYAVAIWDDYSLVLTNSSPW